MGRTLRPYSPGSFFHLIARTQARIHWFDDPIKDRIVEIIADAVTGTDIRLNAFAVMNNHFHLLVRQGSAPLSAFMQPVVRRTALLVQARLQVEDHVFGGPFWDRSCRDVADLRTCIKYIHLNPVRAGRCSDPSDYPWSSHHAYARVLERELWRPNLQVLRAIFATGSCRSEIELCSDYLRFLSDERIHASAVCAGDAIGRDLFACGNKEVRREWSPGSRPDLRDIVLRGITELCPELDLECIRTGRGVWLSKIRAILVQRCARAGYRGCQIARFLHMSESRVSRIIRAMPVHQRVARLLR